MLKWVRTRTRSPVTAEEDDLWSTLPEAVLANQNEQLQYLQNKLTAMREQMGELANNGPQLVFQNPADYEKKDDGLSRWDNPVARRRLNSDGKLELTSSPETVVPSSARRRRSYGDSYSRAKLLGDISARRRALEVCQEEIARNPRRALDFDSSDWESQTKEDSVVPSPPVSGTPTESDDSEPKVHSSGPAQVQQSDKRDLNCNLSEGVGDNTSDNKESVTSDDSFATTPCDSSTETSEQQLSTSEITLPKTELSENSVFQQSEKKRSLSREKAIVDEQAEQLLAPETSITVVEEAEVVCRSPPTETKALDNPEPEKLSEERSESDQNTVERSNQSRDVPLSDGETERETKPDRTDSFTPEATDSDDCKSGELDTGETESDKQCEHTVTVTVTSGDELVEPPPAGSPQVALRDKPVADSQPTSRQSLPANFFSHVPVPPPRKNSPRQKSFKSSPAPAPPAHPPSSPSKRKAPTPPASGASDSRPGSIISSSRSERSNSDGSNLSSPRSKHRLHLSSLSSTSPSTSERSTPATSPSSHRISRTTSPRRCAPQAPRTQLTPPDGSVSPDSPLSLKSLSRSPSKSPAPTPPGDSAAVAPPSDETEKRSTPDPISPPPPVPPPRLKRQSHKATGSDARWRHHSAIEDSAHSPDASEVRHKHQSLPIESFDLDDEFKAQHPSGSAENPADIDSRSINQETTKKHWEQQFASCEVTLFPRPQEPGRKSVSSSDISEFKSEVETESIGDLNSVKRQWEQKAVELQKEKEERDRRMTSSKSFDSLSMSKSYDSGFLPSSKSYDSLKTSSSGQRHMSNNHIYTSYGEADTVDSNSEQYENAIDREIRLAQEREDELRRDHETRLSSSKGALQHSDNEPEKETSEFSHQKAAPSLQAVDGESTVRSPSPVDSGVQSPPPLSLETRGLILDERQKKESIIEREIREQQEKEQKLLYDGQLRSLSHSNKEHEQSEYERREKEQERINAHESIVEREIRLQREREQELQRLRHLVYKEPIHPAEEVSLSRHKADFLEESPRTPEVFDEPEPFTVGAEVAPEQPAFHQPEPAVASQQLPEVTRTSRTLVLSPSHSRDMATPVPYAEAISTYAHAGESMIARELREQKEREEELHRRWREELGLESPLEPCEPDTPYNMPDPVQPRMHVNKGTYQREIKPYKDVTAQILSPHGGGGGGGGGVRRTSIDSESSSRSTASNTADPQQAVPGRHKVQPFKMEDDEREVYQYVPQYETPIEREIRIAREREEEFRQMKGISNVSAGKSKEVPLEMKPPAPRPQALYRRPDEVVPEMSTMKRLAHSRLQQEIQKEKERELDLQRAGHISTTSEDRKGEGQRYVEIIPKDAPAPVAPPSGKTPTTPKTPTYIKSPLTVTSQPPVVAPTTPEPVAAPVKPVQNGNITNGTAVKTHPAHEPLMARRVTKSDGGRRNMAEFKIEKELQEMKEREEELRASTVTSFGRNQREIQSSHRLASSSDEQTTTTTNGTTNGGGATSPQPDEVRHRPRISAPGDQLTKGPRRKSTLAEEWERKISGNASEH